MKLASFMIGLTMFASGIPEVQAATTLRMGTLAPAKSSWMRVLDRAAKEIHKKTNGSVTLKIFPGGSQGDEKVSVEKMRTGQLQAAAITAVGLAEIAPEVLVLQVPQLITSYKMLDKVRGKLRSRFESAMQAKGFRLMGWGDVGLYYFYSTEVVKEPADLHKTKMWAWKDDPTAVGLAKAAGLKSRQSDLPSVLASLSTKRVNTFFTSPLACLQLQWCNHVKYRTLHPISIGIGAMVISEKAFQGLTPEEQAVVTSVMQKWTKALIHKIRKDNVLASKILREKKGITDVEVDDAARAKWNQLGRKVQEALSPAMYSKDLLNEVRGITGN
jgi:TRAP-type C4-dicarboxylate transport system substrate-binding protein